MPCHAGCRGDTPRHIVIISCIYLLPDTYIRRYLETIVTVEQVFLTACLEECQLITRRKCFSSSRNSDPGVTVYMLIQEEEEEADNGGSYWRPAQ